MGFMEPMILGTVLPVSAAWITGGLPKKGDSRDVVEAKMKNVAVLTMAGTLAAVLAVLMATQVKTTATAVGRYTAPADISLVQVD